MNRLLPYQTLLTALLGGSLLLTSSCVRGEMEVTASADQGAAQAPAAADSGTVAPPPLADGEISYEERLDRGYIYVVGGRHVPQIVLGKVLADEAARREAAGGYVGYELDPADVEAGIQESIDQVLAQDANADFWEAIAGLGFTREGYREEVSARQRLMQMYLPEDPELWPVADLKRLMTGSFGDAYDQLLKAEHEKMLAAKAAGEPVAEVNRQTVNQFILPMLVQGLLADAQVEYPSDGLPEGVALRVNGQDYATADIVAALRPLLGPEQMREAEGFVDAMMLAEESLRASGDWLDDEAVAAKWAEERALYEQSFITHDAMVLTFFRFPTMETYRQYFRVRQSFRNTLPDPYPDDMVEQQIADRGLFLGGGKVQATVLLVSARDPRSGRFAMDGDPMGEAERRAAEIAQILQSGVDFLEVLDEYSDIPAEAPAGQQNTVAPNKGRFPLMLRNDLRSMLGESEFTDIVYGYSMTDDIFFHAEPGAVYGPVRIPVGYAFYRVETRAEGAGLDVAANEQHDFLVRDDILGTRTLAFLAGLKE